MTVKIRLSRLGCRHRPHYRITVANSWAKRDGRHIEHIGSYNPVPEADTGNKYVLLNFERARYWLSVGAQPTDTVSRLFGKAGLLPSVPRGPLAPNVNPNLQSE